MFDSKNYPPYDKIRSAKENCYPENIEVSEYGASVTLQSLLDHTVRRIVESSLTSELGVENSEEFVLDGKWGMDDVSGQREQTLKQRSASNDSKTVTEFKQYPSEEISTNRYS